MPLSAAGLGGELTSALEVVEADIASNPPGTEMSTAQKNAINEATGQAIIDHIVANGLITVTVAGGSSAGVHTGTIS